MNVSDTVNELGYIVYIRCMYMKNPKLAGLKEALRTTAVR